MKTKLLFWGGIIFFVLGTHAKDGTLFYFFSVHLFMLYIGMLLYKISYTPPKDTSAEPLPDSESAAK